MDPTKEFNCKKWRIMEWIRSVYAKVFSKGNRKHNEKKNTPTNLCWFEILFKDYWLNLHNIRCLLVKIKYTTSDFENSKG